MSPAWRIPNSILCLSIISMAMEYLPSRPARPVSYIYTSTSSGGPKGNNQYPYQSNHNSEIWVLINNNFLDYRISTTMVHINEPHIGSIDRLKEILEQLLSLVHVRGKSQRKALSCFSMGLESFTYCLTLPNRIVYISFGWRTVGFFMPNTCSTSWRTATVAVAVRAMTFIVSWTKLHNSPKLF